MIVSASSRRRSSRRGAAAAEFAIVAPLFLTLVFGVIQFGRMIMVQQIVINAAREGARAAIVPGETDAQVSSTVNNYLTSLNLIGHDVADAQSRLGPGIGHGAQGIGGSVLLFGQLDELRVVVHERRHFEQLHHDKGMNAFRINGRR